MAGARSVPWLHKHQASIVTYAHHGHDVSKCYDGFAHVYVPLIQADSEVASQCILQLAGPVLEVWAANVADPLVSGDALEVLESLASYPACLPTLARHAAPTLSRIIAGPGSQPPMLVEASLDLLTVLVKPGSMEVAAQVGQQ